MLEVGSILPRMLYSFDDIFFLYYLESTFDKKVDRV